jgi:hypothetical protein
MIFDVNGKRIAFGMQWKSRLSEGDVHRDARAAKSRYFWHADKSFYFGVLAEADSKQKLRAPLFSGAIALLHRFPDVPNLMLVLEIPAGGFIVCGIHQGRPRQGSDTIVQTQVEVSEKLQEFKLLCGIQSFKLFGDVHIGGIEPATMDDVFAGADHAAQLRKTKSALVNPLAFLAFGAVVAGAGGYAWHTYSAYKHAEVQRKAMALQKNSQQLYTEELATRRHDAVILAKDVQGALTPLREMGYSMGGWTLRKATCNMTPDKKMACVFEYARRPASKATFETFNAVAKEFDNLEFAGEAIKATKYIKSLKFVEQGKAIDAAKTQREAVIQFGSVLQRIDNLGKAKRDEFKPFALPPGANAAELTSPPVTVASWEFASPFRNIERIAAFPEYATISQLVVIYADKPIYKLDQSIVMVSVLGRVFSKPQ